MLLLLASVHGSIPVQERKQGCAVPFLLPLWFLGSESGFNSLLGGG